MTATAMTDQKLGPSATRAEDSFLRTSDVLKQLRVARSTLYDMIDKGEFPEPIVLRNRLHRWLQSDVDEYKNQKIAQRRKPFRATHDAR